MIVFFRDEYPLTNDLWTFFPKMKWGLFFGIIFFCSLSATPASASITFTFNFLNPGQGFNDTASGAARRAALNSAADMLGSYFTNYSANLVFDVESYTSNDGTLASAGSPSFISPGTFQQTFVQSKILSNGSIDPNGSAADGQIDWNFSHNWSTTDTPAANEFDLKSVAMHELLHTFGFLSYIGDGGNGLQNITPGTADTWASFDQFLTDSNGNRLVQANGIFDSTKVTALTGGSSVLFNGANAKAANGGNGVPIYSPSNWSAGSSISHVDENTPLTSNMLMSPLLTTGAGVRTLSEIEKGILKDIGYTNLTQSTPPTTSVPFPEFGLWPLAIALSAMLVAFRRRLPV